LYHIITTSDPNWNLDSVVLNDVRLPLPFLRSNSAIHHTVLTRKIREATCTFSEALPSGRHQRPDLQNPSDTFNPTCFDPPPHYRRILAPILTKKSHPHDSITSVPPHRRYDEGHAEEESSMLNTVVA
jgi:hypothetical protein